MAKPLQRDFTQGSIPRHLVLFALPMLAGNMLQVMHNMIDAIWVGRFVGPEALGSVAISFPMIFALLALLIGITTATSTMVSQFRGAKDEENVRRTVTTSMILITVMGLFFTIVGILLRYPILHLIQTPPEVIDGAATYFGIFMVGILGMNMFYVVAATLRGLGDSKTPLRYMALATVLNMILSPLLIIGVGPFPEMGLAGAAFATVFSQTVGSVIALRWLAKQTGLIRFEWATWTWDPRLAKLILKIGIPSGMQQALVSLAMLSVTAVINTFGVEVVAAFGAASRLDNVAILPAMSIGMAVSSVVGQNLGAGRFDRVAATVRWAALLGAVITGAVAAVAILKPTILMVMFTTDPQVLSMGSQYLQTVGWTYVPVAATLVLAGVMRGAGDTVPAMIFTVLTMWLFRLPLAWWLSSFMGTQGIWLGVAISSVAGLLLHYVYYLSGRWQKKVVMPAAPHLAAVGAVGDGAVGSAPVGD